MHVYVTDFHKESTTATNAALQKSKTIATAKMFLFLQLHTTHKQHLAELSNANNNSNNQCNMNVNHRNCRIFYFIFYFF